MPEPAGAIARFIAQGLVETVVMPTMKSRLYRGLPRVDDDDPDPFANLPPLGEMPLGTAFAPPVTEVVLPDDLFGTVVGLEYERSVLRTALVSERPLHVLISGDPGTAKSLLLEEIRRVPQSRYIVGANMTPAGLREMFLDSGDPPRYLLVDEIEKSDPASLAPLLSLMDGRATRAQAGRQDDVEVDVRVIAAANRTDGLHPALRSRMIELPLTAYTQGERHKVIAGFLVAREGMDPKEAEEIAKLVAPRSADVRDAEQIAAVMRADPKLGKQMAERLRHDTRPVVARAARKKR